ncbi:MAG: 5-deoxy-glucuronate isomerase [Spirochaetaceae bacterium]|nr:MAG: 5-deoxy-glucuronate isomerase [Spirochaetaceae bacterium]
MPYHIRPHDNRNEPIVPVQNNWTPLIYFNDVRLQAGESHAYNLASHETVCVVVSGTVTITAGDLVFSDVGTREHLFAGKPDSVYAPRGVAVTITCSSTEAEVFIAGGCSDPDEPSEGREPFRVSPEEVDTVQYGSDDTKTHRRIYHVAGQNVQGRTGNILVSELFTVGAGGWSGFPPHKHHVERPGIETDHEEVFHYRFNPDHGFGAQFAYIGDDDFGPVYHLKHGSTILLDNSYHPSVAAPGYEMYYFTILVGRHQRSLKQYFHPDHEYQVHTIPGLKDMIAKFK